MRNEHRCQVGYGKWIADFAGYLCVQKSDNVLN
jgi:hypothetical protein